MRISYQPLIRFESVPSIFKLFLFYLLVGVAGFFPLQESKAQTLVTESSVPALTPCGDAQLFTVKVKGGTTACATGELTISMPAGFEYVASSLKVNGADHAVETTSTAIDVDVKLPSIPAGNGEMTITYLVRALCEAATVTSPVIDYEFKGCGAVQLGESEAINITMALMRIQSVNYVGGSTGVLGSTITRNITIRNTGTGSMQGVTFTSALGAGLIRVSLTGPNGVTINETSPGIYQIPSHVFGQNDQIVVQEVVQITSCNNVDLNTQYEVYYGCTAKCTLKEANGTASSGITFNTSAQPNLGVTLLTSSTPISCLNQSYTERIRIRNNGTGVSAPGRFTLRGASDADKANVSIVSSSISVTRNGVTSPATGVTTSVHPASNIYGLGGDPYSVAIDVPQLAPGEEITVEYVTYHAGPATGGNCANLQNSYELSRLLYDISYSHLNQCTPTPITSSNQTIRQPVSYSVNGYNVSDLDMTGGEPYAGMYFFSAINFSSAGMGTGGYYAIDIQFSPSLAAAVSGLQMAQGSTVLTPTVTSLGSGRYRFTFNYGNATQWPTGQSLNLTSVQLKFVTELDCALGPDAFYTVSSELNRGGDIGACPGNVIYFRCDRIDFTTRCPSGPGVCADGGISNFDSEVYRVTLGLNPVNPDNTIGSPTSNMFIGAFTEYDIVEFRQSGTIHVTGTTPGGGWERIRFVIKPEQTGQYSAMPNSGRLEIVDESTNITHTLTNIPVALVGSEYRMNLNFAAMGAVVATPALPAGFKLGDADQVTAYLQLRALPQSASQTRLFIPTEIAVLDASDTEYICNGDYSATALYIASSSDFVTSSNSQNLTGCETEVAGVQFTATVASLNRADVVFTDEHLIVSRPQTVTINIPEALTLVGYKLELVGQPGGTKTYLQASGSIPPATGGQFVINLADAAIRAQLGNNNHWDEGFILRVRPILSANCNDLASAKLGFIGVYQTRTAADGGIGYFAETSPLREVTYNFDNNKLSLSASATPHVASNTLATWVVRLQNTSSFRGFTNTWIKQDGGAGTVVSIVPSNASGVPNGSPALVDQSGYYVIGNTSTGYSQYFLVTAELPANCDAGTVLLNFGNQCGTFDPTSACARGTELTLNYTRGAANLQMLMRVTPAASARPGLCESLDFEVELQNNGTGDAKELFLRIPLTGASALTFIDGSLDISDIFIPGGTPGAFNPVAAGVAEVVDGELLIRLDPNFELPKERALRLRFALTYDNCDFISGRRVTFHVAAKNICGSVATVPPPVNSERITIGSEENFEEPSLEKINPSKLEMTFSDTSTPTEIRGLYSYSIRVNAPTAATRDVFHFSVQLPADWTFVDPAAAVDPAQAQYVGFETGRGYVFKLIADVPVGGVISITEAPIVYGGDPADVLCDQYFGKSYERIYALLTPIKAPGCTADCSVFEHEIFMTESTFDMTPPPAPAGDANQTLCAAGPLNTVTLADLVLTTGQYVQWFATNDLSQPLPMDTDLVDGVTYYARSKWNTSLDCYSTTALAVTVTLEQCFVVIRGTVFNDITGDSDGLNGVGTNIENVLYVNLIDPSGTVAETVAVNADGTYLLARAYRNTPNYRVQISINQGVVGNPAPATELPAEWVHTGDYPANINDTTPDGSITVNTGAVDIEDINFGIEHRPTAEGDDAASQINPGGTNKVEVPADIFGGTDPDNGIITRLILTEFPTNTTTLEIDGVEYTTIADIEAAYPNGIPTSANGQPSVPIQVDPIDGTVEVEFTFKVVDNAGVISTDPATSMMPFEARNPVIELDKTSTAPNAVPEAGDEITYTFKVRNLGNVPLSQVVITEDQFSGAGVTPLVLNFISADQGSAAGTLKVGEEATYEAIYKLVQEDVDAGKLTNKAMASGYDKYQPGVDSTYVSDEDDHNIKLVHTPTMILAKTGEYKGDVLRAEIGDAVAYEFILTNTGNVTLSNIVVEDDHLFTGTGTAIQLSAPVASAGSTPQALAPDGTLTYTATYYITQADIDAGEVVNQALANAKSPNTDDDPTGIPVDDLSDDPNDPSNTDSEGDNEPDDPTIVPLPQMPLIEMTKVGVYRGAPDAAYPGDEIEYTFVVINKGNVTLANVEVSEESFSGAGNPVSVIFSHASAGSSEATLMPEGQLTYTAVYKVHADDINEGKVVNQAIVSAYPPGKNTPITDLSDDPNDPYQIDYENDSEPDDPTVVPLPIKPNMSLTKVGSFNDEGALKGQAEVGETISYVFTLTNTGNVDLENVRVTESAFSGTGVKPVLRFVAGSAGSSEQRLKPEGTLTYEATYAITQADINAGEVVNQAKAVAYPPLGGDPIEDLSDDPSDPTNEDLDGNGDPDDPTVVILPNNPSIALLKDSEYNDENNDGFAQVGETITYFFTITNDGQTTLTDIRLSDPLISGDIRLPKTILQPGESMQATANYVVKQSDIDRGGVYNQATVTGNDPGGKSVEDKSNDPTPLDPQDPDHPGVDPNCPDCTITPLPPNPGLEIDKKSLQDSYQNIGEKITFVLNVINTGNVTLNNVIVTDVLFPNWSETIPRLGPGESREIRVEYTVVQADIERGHVMNVAKATGTDPGGNDHEDEDDVEVPFVPQPSIELEKTADKPFVRDVGEVITYTLVVRNTGNVELKNVLVQDPLTGFSQVVESLKVGESRSFETKYTVRVTDLPNRKIVNVATAEGTAPDGGKVTDEDDVEVPIGPDGEFKIPNVFTPNGDGFNDTFEIIGLHGFDRVEILIFNRWGNEVYRSRNYKNDWAGLNLNEGTYYYIIQTHKGNVRNDYKGWVLLKRN